ncbi:hypothetical protein D9M68_656800 [compost metagenome]
MHYTSQHIIFDPHITAVADHTSRSILHRYGDDLVIFTIMCDKGIFTLQRIGYTPVWRNIVRCIQEHPLVFDLHRTDHMIKRTGHRRLFEGVGQVSCADPDITRIQPGFAAHHDQQAGLIFTVAKLALKYDISFPGNKSA